MMNNSQNNSLKQNNSNFDIAWNESKLFYLYIDETDRDYKEAYYTDNWPLMSKSFRMKYMKVRPYLIIKKVATEKELEQLFSKETFDKLLEGMKSGSNNWEREHNSTIASKLLDILIEKMFKLDELMAKAGLYLLLNKKDEYKPAALAGDDI